MKHLVVIILLLFLIIYNCVSQAQWVQTNGPNGGTVSCFAVSGTNVFAGALSSSGVSRSSNNGASWVQVGLKNETVTCLGVSGVNIFAGTHMGGMFLSSDNGTSWTQVNNGLTNTRVWALTVSGTNIFIGTFEVNEPGGVFLSTNNGANWVPVGLEHLVINCLTTVGNRIYAGTSDCVYVTADNGTTWTRESNGLIDKTYGVSSEVYSLVINRNNIFAGTSAGSYHSGGVFKSTDNGVNWSSSGLSGRYIHSLKSSGSNIFAGTDSGAFISTNNGTNWIQIDNGLTDIHVLSLIISGNNIFAGTDNGGVFLSTNDGNSWIQVGLVVSECRSLAIKGSVIFAGTYRGGVNISTNWGTSWRQINNGFLTDADVLSLAFSGNNVLAGTNPTPDSKGNYSFGLFLSTNNGENWSKADSSSQIYYSFAIKGANIYAGTYVGVLVSTNNGSNWTNVGPSGLLINSLAVSGNNIYAGAYNSGVYLSSDNGVHWTQRSVGLSNIVVNSVVVNGNNIYAGTTSYQGSPGVVFLSTDNGTNWTPFNDGMTSSTILSFAVSGTNLFAGTDNGVFLLSNSGKNWAQVGLNSITVSSLAVNETTIFAGTFGAAVWKRPLSDFTPVTTNCPLSQGYWKNHPDKWPGSMPMMLGTLNSYNLSKLLKIFSTPIKGDASIILAYQLIAAKLNVANNSPLPNEVQNAIANSDAAIGTAVIPANVRPNSILGKTMTSLAAILDKYNNDLLTLGCQQEQRPALELSKFNDQTGLVDKYELLGNYPEPFNPTTKISFILPEANFVTLKIYNSVGQLVKTLVNENMNKGYHTLEWNATNDNGNNLATGIYLYRLQAGNFVKTSKMIFMK